jgi:hypothetical protein
MFRQGVRLLARYRIDQLLVQFNQLVSYLPVPAFVIVCLMASPCLAQSAGTPHHNAHGHAVSPALATADVQLSCCASANRSNPMQPCSVGCCCPHCRAARGRKLPCCCHLAVGRSVNAGVSVRAFSRASGGPSLPIAYSAPNGLPPCNLDSFVHEAGGAKAELIYGDEGANSKPPIFGYTSESRINAGIVGERDKGLTTGHACYLPDATGADEFISAGEWSQSGANGGDRGLNGGAAGMDAAAVADATRANATPSDAEF